MGALRKTMKWTTVTFTVGWLAIAGIPPLAGFWSKGDVLDNVYAHYKALWALGLLTADPHRLLHDPPADRWPSAASRAGTRSAPTASRPCHTPHESPWVMRLPLVILAVAAFFGRHPRPALDPPRLLRGLAGPGLRRQPLQRPPARPGGEWALALTDAAAAVIGLVVGVGLWRGAAVDKPAARAAVPPAGLVLGRLLRRRHRAPEPEAGHLLRLGGRRPHHRRRGQRHRRPRALDRLGHPQAADRLRAQLRAGHRPRAWPP